MSWQKLKRLFIPDNNFNWMYSHASNAVFTEGKNGINRIYFSCRDQNSRSHIAYIDVDFNDNFKIVNISEKPVLSPGDAGTFDDSGVVMGCLTKVSDKLYLYYLGWNLKVTVPWLNSIGLAIYDSASDSFKKNSVAPLLDRNEVDPFSISYPFVLFDNGVYKMWYGSNLSWGADQKSMNHVIKYAESIDGINWNRSGQIAVNLLYDNEYALSKPWVIKENGLFKMWYSYRGKDFVDEYRIGYAESLDGLLWERKDNLVGVEVSNHGWDSQMISYPCVFDYDNERYLLYNGNNYGATGFGIAKWKN
jgi:predicted GH43/DUF377 family glycosyl hydrolase|tara:strand:- start:651 stop:1565 length:915 start_codon:yes stop_codon:yes gene_type:complete